MARDSPACIQYVFGRNKLHLYLHSSGETDTEVGDRVTVEGLGCGSAGVKVGDWGNGRGAEGTRLWVCRWSGGNPFGWDPWLWFHIPFQVVNIDLFHDLSFVVF